jgi:hypothetical protein
MLDRLSNMLVTYFNPMSRRVGMIFDNALLAVEVQIKAVFASEEGNICIAKTTGI